jgi:Ala-tRNA(Pro) deacylase
MRRPALYDRLLNQLDARGARYQVIEHPCEGRTEVVSRYRRNPLAQAAKCIVVRVALGRRHRRYVLAVVPGDRRVDLSAVCHLYGGVSAAFAQRETAERLAGCVSGCIMPLSYHPDLPVVVDRRLLTQPCLYFNAARLDRSVVLHTDDYLALARPRVAAIAEAAGGAEMAPPAIPRLQPAATGGYTLRGNSES